MSTQQTHTTVGAHLVGGLHASDTETAMTTAARILGRHLYAVPDGETGDRSQWILWQVDKLTAIDGIDLVGTHGVDEADNQDYAAFPSIAVDRSVTEMAPGALGYSDAAMASYEVFKRLREHEVVPADVKFQVSMPTPYATVIAWIREEDQERFFPIYADAIAAEIAKIAQTVGDDLLLQHDVAVEIGALTGNFATLDHFRDKSVVIDSLRAALDRTPAGVEQGVHLCYGDYKHRHFAIPQDLGLCVELANAVTEKAAYIHMPVDRETGRNPRYFEPLRDLSARRLALGVIDYNGDEQRTHELIGAADAGSGEMEYAVATECGMARIMDRVGGPPLERLLELHAAVAAAIR